LIPASHKIDQPEPEAPAVDPQAFVDAMLSPDSFEEPPPAPAEEAPAEAVEEPSEPTPAAEAPAEEPGKKPAKGKKTKA
jgi:hypothetical protein